MIHLRIPLEVFVMYTYLTTLEMMHTYSGSLAGFHKCTTLHAFHAIFTCMLVTLQLDIFAISFSAAFFTLDLLSCIKARDKVFTLHAVIALALVPFGFWDIVRIKRGARLLLVEASTPFYILWKTNKTKWNMSAFAFVFFICRVLLIPTMIYEFWDIPATLPILTGLYILNLGWFYRMIEILITNVPGREGRRRA